MTVNEITPEMIEAAALKWATIDGKKNRFLGDKDGKFGDCDGTYEGYCEEARQVLTAALAAAPAPQPVESPEGLEAFTAWFVRNYPGPDTVIFNPNWHAPKIYRAVRSALVSATTAEIDRLKAENERTRKLLVETDLWEQHKELHTAEARIAELEASEKRMREALEWYGEQSRLARLITSEGDPGRNAICADGGTRARAALAKEGE